MTSPPLFRSEAWAAVRTFVRTTVPLAVVLSVGRIRSLADSFEHVPRKTVSLYVVMRPRPLRLTEMMPAPDVSTLIADVPLMPPDPTLACQWTPAMAALAGPTTRQALTTSE